MKSTDRKFTSTERMLNALDALSKPQHIAEWQGEGNSKHIFRRTDPPLLDWLREAIVSNMGGSGGGRQARERTPMAVGAFTLYEDIDGRIRSWMMEAGGTPIKAITPTQIIRSWYALWQTSNPTDHRRDAYSGIMEGWADAIRDNLDPPKKIEITAPCPICGQEWINIGLKLLDGQDDPDDVERVRTLIAVERDNINESYAICKACDKVWKGVGQMRWLRIAIDDADATKATA
ncbi:hypothetical protein [Glaciihabitans sp. UYNi722]|uniref:DUF7341 domain-containing protein n=1 Tax=Glaciihabitans sp. UYNi722 TaxID=3156344 RepID=UPI003399D3D1